MTYRIIDDMDQEDLEREQQQFGKLCGDYSLNGYIITTPENLNHQPPSTADWDRYSFFTVDTVEPLLTALTYSDDCARLLRDVEFPEQDINIFRTRLLDPEHPNYQWSAREDKTVPAELTEFESHIAFSIRRKNRKVNLLRDKSFQTAFTAVCQSIEGNGFPPVLDQWQSWRGGTGAWLRCDARTAFDVHEALREYIESDPGIDLHLYFDESEEFYLANVAKERVY